ncbi:uncharacterized protein LOC102807956, partial [Saccoglossus kowalevskii]
FHMLKCNKNCHNGICKVHFHCAFCKKSIRRRDDLINHLKKKHARNVGDESTGPSAKAESTGPSAKAESTGPSAKAESTGPSAKAESTGPSAKAEPSGPSAKAESIGTSAKAESTGPSAKAEYTGPSAKAESTGPSAKAESTGTSAKAESTGPSAKAEPSGPSAKAESTGPRIKNGSDQDTGKEDDGHDNQRIRVKKNKTKFQQTVKCKVCSRIMQKKHLSRHSREMHSKRLTVRQERHHKSVCVDKKNGIYMVSKVMQGTGYPLHIQKIVAGFPQNVECENPSCRATLQAAS